MPLAVGFFCSFGLFNDLGLSFISYLSFVGVTRPLMAVSSHPVQSCAVGKRRGNVRTAATLIDSECASHRY